MVKNCTSCILCYAEHVELSLRDADQQFARRCCEAGGDGRDKPGHDDVVGPSRHLELLFRGGSFLADTPILRRLR